MNRGEGHTQTIHTDDQNPFVKKSDIEYICLDIFKILGSESFARWLVSLALELVLVLALGIELVLDIEPYHITASVSH